MKSLNVVQKIAKVLHIISKIMFWIYILGTAAMPLSILLIKSALLGDESVHKMMTEMSVSNKLDLGVAYISQTLAMLGIIIAMWFICEYLKNELSAGTPFTKEGAKELLKAGIISVVLPLAALGLSNIMNALIKIKLNELNEGFLSLGISLIILSTIFKYGADIIDEK